MGVGTGVVLALLWERARGGVRALSDFAGGGPFVLAATAILFGVVRLAPLVYSPNRDDNLARNVVSLAAEHAHLENALVWLEPDQAPENDLRNITQNLPVELYPDQKVFTAYRLMRISRARARMFPKREAVPHSRGVPLRPSLSPAGRLPPTRRPTTEPSGNESRPSLASVSGGGKIRDPLTGVPRSESTCASPYFSPP